MEKKYGFYAITSTFVGSIFGAGFVSGQELLQFYASYGLYCIFGLILMFLLYVALSYMTMTLSFDKQLKTYEEAIAGKNEKAKAVCNAIINIIIFFILIVMFAGFGSLLNNFFGINTIIGSVILAVLVMVICLLGAQKIVNVFKFIVPTMIVLALCTAGLGIIYGNSAPNFEVVEWVKQPTPFWFASALLAVSYIFIVQIPILSPLGKNAKNKKEIIIGSILGPLAISLVATLICFALLKNLDIIVGVDMPMMIISKNISGALGIVTLVVLAVGIFSSSLAMMFALINRISQSKFNNEVTQKITIIVICLSALILSLVGFSNLIAIVYPIVGYIGFAFNGGVVFQFFRNRSPKKVYKELEISEQQIDDGRIFDTKETMATLREKYES